jgi:hypothetical protein
MFCSPGLIFGGTEVVWSLFHVLLSRTRFQRYRGRRVPFSCFPLPESFSAVPWASIPVLMFCAPGLIFDGTEGVGSRFHVLSSRIHFRRYRGRRDPLSCFALLDSFEAVSRALGPVLMFCAPGLVFGGIEGLGSLFHVLRARTHFWRYRGRRVPFSCFALPDSFSAVPRASGPVIMFCAPGFILSGIEGVGSRFNVLRSRTRFRRYRGCRVPFSCFALPNSFSEVPRASGSSFTFCSPGLIFSGNEGVGFLFHVLRSWTHFRRYRGRRAPFSCFVLPDSFSAVPRASVPVFLFYAPGLILRGKEGVRSLFHVLRIRTRFRRYRGWPIPFSCFTRPDSFSAVPRAWGSFFMFSAPGLVFGDAECVGSHFHVLRSRTRFRRCRVRRVPFSCFACPDTFSAVLSASGSFFMFCAPGLVFGGAEFVGSRFHVFRAHTPFQRHRGRRVPFSCFALLDSFSVVSGASGSFFMFCAPGLIFGSTDNVESRFNVLRSRTSFWRY